MTNILVIIFYIDALRKLCFTFMSVKHIDLKLNYTVGEHSKMRIYRRELSLSRDVFCHFCIALFLIAAQGQVRLYIELKNISYY